MPVHRLEQSIVIIADPFSPDILSHAWLAGLGVIPKGPTPQGSTYTDGISNTVMPEFTLLAVRNRIQFSISCKAEQPERLIKGKLCPVINALPQVPYKAIGFNFAFCAVPRTGGISAVTRRLFFSPDNRLLKHFDEPEAEFGTFASRDWRDLRLHLDVKPGRVDSTSFKGAALLFLFNFHKDLPGESRSAEDSVAGEIEKILALWEEAAGESEKLVNVFKEEFAS
jgi:hypothetical protein